MFQSESAPREIRGAVVSSYQLMITIGILVSNIINYGIRNIQDQSASWRIVIGLSIAFSIPLAIGVMLVPESPRWMAGQDDWEGTRMCMARLRGLKHDPTNPLVEADLQEMMEIIQREQREGQGTWVECFSASAKVPKTLYRTLLGTGIQFFQQWTGGKSQPHHIPPSQAIIF
jgi:SP family sugar:H+ symporter-like MFS transporter